MNRKLIYSIGLSILFGLFLYILVEKRTGGSVGGTVDFAARENRILPLREIQIYAVQQMAIEDIQSVDQLLPADKKLDPWGTPFDCLLKDDRFCIHSAGPDKSMHSRPLFPCDDILVFKTCVVDLSMSLSDLEEMMNRYSEPLIAEVLLNCDDESYQSSARKWLIEKGYITSFPAGVGFETW